MNAPLSEQDRLTVLETLAEIRSEPPRRNYAGVGCVMALPGFVLLLVFPMVGRFLEVEPAVAVAVLILGGILLVVGLILWYTAGGLERGHAVAAAEAALRTLESGEEDREVLLRAATLLLCNAYATYGPATAEAFDFVAAGRRMGPRLALVMGVENVLLGEEVIYPVFTQSEPAEPAGEG